MNGSNGLGFRSIHSSFASASGDQKVDAASHRGESPGSPPHHSRPPKAMRRPILTLCALLPLAALPAAAQAGGGHPASLWSPGIAATPPVRDALRWIDGNFPAQVLEWKHLTGIPAPS